MTYTASVLDMFAVLSVCSCRERLFRRWFAIFASLEEWWRCCLCKGGIESLKTLLMDVM